MLGEGMDQQRLLQQLASAQTQVGGPENWPAALVNAAGPALVNAAGPPSSSGNPAVQGSAFSDTNQQVAAAFLNQYWQYCLQEQHRLIQQTGGTGQPPVSSAELVPPAGDQSTFSAFSNVPNLAALLPQLLQGGELPDGMQEAGEPNGNVVKEEPQAKKSRKGGEDGNGSCSSVTTSKEEGGSEHNKGPTASGPIRPEATLATLQGLPAGFQLSLAPASAAMASAGPAEGSQDGMRVTSSNGGTVHKCAKEKNRQAQRRFRERQKGLIHAYKANEDKLARENEELKRALEEDRRTLATLREENQVLRQLMHEHASRAV